MALNGGVPVSNLDRSKRQLHALISAVRPSIIWRVDGQTAPLDLLDDNGIAGWRVGVLAVLPRLGRCSDPQSVAIGEWLTRDQMLEQERWHDPQAVLTQALEVLSNKSWGDHRDPKVLDRWVQNVDAALARYPLQQTAPTPFTQRQAAKLHTLLANEPGTELTRRRLARLAQADPTPGVETPRLRCLSLASRCELRAIGQWLAIDRRSRPHLAADNTKWIAAPELAAASA